MKRLTNFAAGASVLLAVALLWPHWIESLIGFDPDGGSGSSELTIAILFALPVMVAGVAYYFNRVRQPQ
jgi:hypothetical protein